MNNDSTRPDHAADAPWTTADQQVQVPNTSLLPGSEKAPPAAVSLMRNAVRGAHDTIDRLAAGAAPAVRQLGERVSAADDALRATADQLRNRQVEWADNVRTTVRSNPLASIAAAATLGALTAHITLLRAWTGHREVPGRPG